MNKRILNLAIPNIISNITVPVLGMVDIAIAGRVGAEAAIGAIAVGIAIFSLIYWNCAFLRLGSNSLAAQAYGARQIKECANILVRSVLIALSIAIVLLIAQTPIVNFCLLVVKASDEVTTLASEYYYARIWAVPATVSMFAIHGWFIGMQNSKAPMMVSIIAIFFNIAFSLIFVYVYDLGVAGVAWGTVVTQYISLIITVVIWMMGYGKLRKYFTLKGTFNFESILHFMKLNKDLFIRTFIITIVYNFFTVASAAYGDTVLAANAILIQLMALYNYVSEGFAYAAQALTGLFIGAKNYTMLRICTLRAFFWSGITALIFVAVFALFWSPIVRIFTPSQVVVECAGNYVIWVILMPLVGFSPFLLDGLLLGATKAKILRNGVFISAVIFFVSYYLLKDIFGNNALWLSFIVFLGIRGIIIYYMTGRMREFLDVNRS